MTRPSTILLVPHDPAMLAEGPLGERPPTMAEHTHKDGGKCWLGFDRCQRARLLADPRPGLVIAHDEELHEIGLAWLGVAIGTGPMDAMRVAVRHVLLSPEPDSWAHTRLSEWGTLVYLDADGEADDGE